MAAGARGRSGLHDQEVHHRGLSAAVVVLRWRQEPTDYEPDQYPADRQPLFQRRLDRGYSGNILADWDAPNNNRWTVPIGLGVSKVVKFGRLPVKIQLAGQYMVTQPNPVGQQWNVQVVVTPVLPKLIKGTLFK